jgi:hypothetical protein
MGTEITGARANIAFTMNPTWGTITAATSTSGVQGTLSHGENAAELAASPVGSGDVGPADSQRGATSPGWHSEPVITYNDSSHLLAKQFFGNEYVYPGLSGMWSHVYMMNENFNSSFIGLGAQITTQSLIEYPSGVVTKLGYSTAPGDYVKVSADVLADQLRLTGQTNSMALLDAAVTASSERITCDSSDEFLINAQSGAALATGTDRIENVSTFAVEYSKDHEHVRECKGALGNGIPVSSGTPPFAWTVTVTVPRPDKSTWLYAAQQGYEYKALFSCTGSLIAGSAYNKITWYFPRLKLISDVKWDLANAGINPMTVVFKGLVATANPTGMLSTYPYIAVQNTKTTVGA